MYVTLYNTYMLLSFLYLNMMTLIHIPNEGQLSYKREQ